MIKYIVKKLIPDELIKPSQNKDEIVIKVTEYVIGSIDNSGFFVKFAEKPLRIFTYVFFKFFSLIELISLKKIKFEDCLGKSIKASTLIGDGIRLYKSLAFFALFENIKSIENKNFYK